MTLAQRQSLVAGWLFLTPILCFSTELNKFDSLVQAVYDLEVTAYCGLTSDQVISGYRILHERLVQEGALDRDQIDAARSEGWQAAHAEWQNRGLGGFRGWCKNEGHAAAEALRHHALVE